MTIEDLTTPQAAILLTVTTATVAAIKRVIPVRISKASWFRRSLPLVACIVGALLASTGLIWADAEVRHRITAGALVGLVGPALFGLLKRRTPPSAA